MTREEAIKVLNMVEAYGLADEAKRMAIEALEHEPSEDLISRADAVKRLLLFKQSRAKIVSGYDIGFEDGLSHAINILDLVPLVYIPSINIENIEEEPKTEEWIPCSERLPREYAQYLVYFETGECYVYWLEDSDWARGMAEKEGILAWMPLPKPYREDGEK